LGATHKDVVVITAAMGGPTGLAEFASSFPDRFFDVGIAEQHALASAAGLVLAGAHPVVAVYSTFLNRAIDQVLMDVSLHRSPVTIVLDRAGITGPDGPSHHGMWDLSLVGMVPSLQVAAPRDPTRLRQLLDEAIKIDSGPTLLRFPRADATVDFPAVDCICGVDFLHIPEPLRSDVLLVAIGAMAAECVQVPGLLTGQGVGVTVVDPRWVLPVNPVLADIAARHAVVVTVEDGIRLGGVGAQIAQCCVDSAVSAPVYNLGLPRSFIEHGTRAELLATAGLTPQGIAARVLSIWTLIRDHRSGHPLPSGGRSSHTAGSFTGYDLLGT
jgi:1-deoxy-D-xylulose-5-phosphate synthase